MLRNMLYAAGVACCLFLTACGGGSNDPININNQIPDNSNSTSSQLDATARFNRPGDIVAGRNNTLYLIDRGNQVVRSISASGEVGTLPGNYDERSRMTIDSGGNLIILSGVDIFRVAPDGNKALIKSYAQAPGSYTPRRVAADARGNIYVLTSYSQIYRIERINPGHSVDQIYYLETFGEIDKMASDSEGNIVLSLLSPVGNAYMEYVPITAQSNVDLHSSLITAWPAERAYFQYGQMVFDQSDNLYSVGGKLANPSTSDILSFASFRVGRIAEGGAVTDIFDAMPSGDNTVRQVAASTYINIGLAAGSLGDLYLTDPFDHAVYKINSDGTTSLVAGKPGEAGSSD